MQERAAAVTFLGNPLTLIGTEVKPGDKAPDFQALDTDLNPKGLKDFAGKTLLVVAVPSLDTSVCSLEARRFDQETAALGDAVKTLVISLDLPFAQKRWQGEAGAQGVTLLSDHREASFGLGYGLLIKELRLLARAVLVIDPAGVVRYVQLVKEVTNEPNYDEALQAAKATL